MCIRKRTLSSTLMTHSKKTQSTHKDEQTLTKFDRNVTTSKTLDTYFKIKLYTQKIFWYMLSDKNKIKICL